MNKKFKIMNQRPQASDEEIKNFMDFKGVLTQHNQQIRIIKRTSLIKKIALTSVVLITVGIVYWTVQKQEQPSVALEKDPAKNQVSVVTDENNTPSEPAVEKAEEPAPASPVKKSPDDVVKKENTKPEPTSPQPTTEEKPAEESYVQAEPAKGYQELYDYFSKNLVYPKEALKDSIQGVSTVSFIVNKDGSHAKLEVVNSLGPAFDKEIARLIESMPEWKPALLNGKPVPSKISLPITFQFQKVTSK